MARRRTVSGVIVVGLVFVLTVGLAACGSAAPESDTSAVKVTNGYHDPAENFQIFLPVGDAAREAAFRAEDPNRSVIPNGSEGHGPQRRLTVETVTAAMDAGQGAVAFWPGPEVAGYPLTAVMRNRFVDELPGMADPPVIEKVTFIYGDCEPTGPGRRSCSNLPIHVVTSGKRCPASALPEFGNAQRRPPKHLPPVRGALVDARSGGVVAYVGERNVAVFFANAAVAQSVLATFPDRTDADRALGLADAGRAILGELRGVGRLTADVGPSTTFPSRPKSIGTYTAGDCPRSQSSFAK
jgi:hypothetical protein